jgi:hypothetical protein
MLIGNKIWDYGNSLIEPSCFDGLFEPSSQDHPKLLGSGLHNGSVGQEYSQRWESGLQSWVFIIEFIPIGIQHKSSLLDVALED